MTEAKLNQPLYIVQLPTNVYNEFNSVCYSSSEDVQCPESRRATAISERLLLLFSFLFLSSSFPAFQIKAGVCQDRTLVTKEIPSSTHLVSLLNVSCV